MVPILRAGGKPSSQVENLNARIKAWWVMVALIGVAFMVGKAGVIALFAFISFGCLREFLTLTDTKRGDHYALAAAFFIVLPFQYYLVWIEWYGLFSIFIPVYVFLLLPIVTALRGDTSNYMVRIAEVQWGVMICVFCISHVPALLIFQVEGFEGRELLLIGFLVAVVQSSDVLQYVWGKLIGRTKIAPSLSPSKTVEGFLGGIASATAIGAALWVDHALHPAAGRCVGFRDHRDGFLRGPRHVGDQAGPRHQGLGTPDRGPRRHDGSPGFGGVLGSDLLSSGSILVGAVIEAIRRLARRGAVHVLFAFLAMGGWAVLANVGHPLAERIVAGVVQGAMSACLTFFLKTVIDALAKRLTGRTAFWLPPLVACFGSAMILVAVHRLNGTPEILKTIAVPLLVSTSYAALYSYSIFRKRVGWQAT